MTWNLWVVWSVGLPVRHSREPCKNGWTDQDAVWIVDSDGPKKVCIRWRFRSPTRKGHFEGQKGRPVVRYRESLPWYVQKQLNRSRFRSGCGLGCVKGRMCKMMCTLAPPDKYDWTVLVRRRCGLMLNYIIWPRVFCCGCHLLVA